MSLNETLTPEESALLDRMEAELFRLEKEDDPPELLFHYTTPEGFHGILEKKEIWATHFRFLNDPREVIHGEELALQVVKELYESEQDDYVRGFLDMFVNNFNLRLSERAEIYVASFSENSDQLSQWRAYGGQASGYSIGFSRLPQPRGDSEDAIAGMSLVRCQYDDGSFRDHARRVVLEMAHGFAKFTREDATREECARALLGQSLGICWRRLLAEILRLKNHGFVEEGEWRLVLLPAPDNSLARFRFGPGGLVPYFPIPLVLDDGPLPIGRITVGPGNNAHLSLLAAEMLLGTRGIHSNGVVVPSKIPYRNVR